MRGVADMSVRSLRGGWRPEGVATSWSVGCSVRVGRVWISWLSISRVPPDAWRRRPPARRRRSARAAPACRPTRAPGTRARSRRASSSASAGRGRARGSRSPARTASPHARERAVKRGRAVAFGRRQLDVAARHREPVGSRTVGQTSIRDRDVEVAHEAPDHARLLGVLLAEVRDVRADHVEQLRDDRRDAVEMGTAAVRRPRASRSRRGPTRWSRSPAGTPPRPRARTGSRRRLGGQPGVALRSHAGTRPGRRVVELRRVHEQRHDDHVALLARAAHQRQVTVVERAHRRDEADRAPARRGGASSARSSATVGSSSCRLASRPPRRCAVEPAAIG